MTVAKYQPCHDLDPGGILSGAMEKAIRDGVFPGAVLLVGRAGRVVFHEAFGTTGAATSAKVDCGTVYDLASLTKPLATSLAVMALLKEGLMDLDQQVGDLLPRLAATSKGAITVRQLLAHRSGLPAWRPYFQTLRLLPPGQRRNGLRRLLAEEDLEALPGAKTCYSDLGFMLLAWIVEEVSGQRLDILVRNSFYKPLGLERELFFVDLLRPRPERRFAATENCPWRGRVLLGEVHDDNAHVAGGIEGHAGLFGTAWGVWKLMEAMARCYGRRQPVGPFDPGLVAEFFAPQQGGRSLGFDRVTAGASSAGRFFSSGTVGHLGFTGTSFWVDPDREVAVILLTNRVNPSRENERIADFRPVLHDEIMKLVAGSARKIN